jgi:lysophospholipase L1-like esterase
MALRYLALGDSYTIGEGMPEIARWPMQLAARLREQGRAIDPPRILATTGWTTDELAAAMTQASFAPPYDLVSLLIGVNDQYRGRDAETFRRDSLSLLDRAIALTGGLAPRTLAVSIPDWSVTRFGRESGRDVTKIAAQIDAFNAIARDEAGRRGCRFVDVTAISRAQPDATAADGLHPDAAQYAAWTAVILPAAHAALGTR